MNSLHCTSSFPFSFFSVPFVAFPLAFHPGRSIFIDFLKLPPFSLFFLLSRIACSSRPSTDVALTDHRVVAYPSFLLIPSSLALCVCCFFNCPYSGSFTPLLAFFFSISVCIVVCDVCYRCCRCRCHRSIAVVAFIATLFLYMHFASFHSEWTLFILFSFTIFTIQIPWIIHHVRYLLMPLSFTYIHSCLLLLLSSSSC
jgi:hypothetical protein